MRTFKCAIALWLATLTFALPSPPESSYKKSSENALAIGGQFIWKDMPKAECLKILKQEFVVQPISDPKRSNEGSDIEGYARVLPRLR